MIINLFDYVNKKFTKKKYTCSCCGYRTLADNGMGEICQVCYWEEDFVDANISFEYSSANQSTLYEAQKNFNKIGASQRRFINNCRKPFDSESKDPTWLSIEDRIECQYKDTAKAINMIKRLMCQLKYPNANYIYKNFKSLPEILINHNHDYDDCVNEAYNCEVYESQLMLEALATYLKKAMESNLINLIIIYYKKGLDYYVGWYILLIVALSSEPVDISEKLSEILIDIDINDFYGLDSLKVALETYWVSQYIFPKIEIVNQDNIHLHIACLMDENTYVGTREEIVMDLSDSDLPEAENTLIKLAYHNNDRYLDEAIGEGIGQIWARKNKLPYLCLDKIPSSVRQYIINTISYYPSLLDVLYDYASNSKIAMSKKCLEDIARFSVYHFESVYHSAQRDEVVLLSVRTLKILDRALINEKLMDFYKLCLTTITSHDIKLILQLADRMVNTNHYESPKTKLEHYAYLYVNTLISYFANQTDCSKQYEAKLSRYVETYFPQYKQIASLTKAIIESNFSIVQQREKLLCAIDFVKNNKKSEFYTFHTYLLILFAYLVKIPFQQQQESIK